MVQGYRDDLKRPPANEIGPSTVIQVKQVGFYNTKGLIIQIDFSDLKAAVKSINKN
jgi:hypothetical protein